MNDEQRYLKNIVQSAIEIFNKNESYLVLNNASERSVCSRFAYILQNIILKNEPYKDYICDVEYNIGYNGIDNERKMRPDTNKKIVVDLIVHKRGYNPEPHKNGEGFVDGYSNLICIEMKKYNNAQRVRDLIDNDKNRLRILVNRDLGFNYSIGFMILINRDGLVIDDEFYDNY